MRYGYVKKWFLAAYPDISDFTPAEFIEMQDVINPVAERFEAPQVAQNLPLAS
jgi:hypothetical protein